MAAAQDKWEAPADESSKVNPLTVNADNVNKGREIFTINCKSCHGDPGKHNGIPLPPINPPDLASEAVQANSDGALFYFITTGRVTMPSFKAILPEDDRWKLAMFIKSFGKGAEQFVSPSQLALEGTATLTVDINNRNKKISAVLNDVVDTISKPIAGVRVDFFVKRYFGNLKFNSAVTDGKGRATVDFPENIAGDTTGCVTLVVKSDTNMCSAEKLVKNTPICSVHYATNIFEKRVMWSENDKTLWWVILSYLGVVAGVWLTILYVVSLFGQIGRAHV